MKRAFPTREARLPFRVIRSGQRLAVNLDRAGGRVAPSIFRRCGWSRDAKLRLMRERQHDGRCGSAVDVASAGVWPRAEGPGGTLLFERMTGNLSHLGQPPIPEHRDCEFREGP